LGFCEEEEVPDWYPDPERIRREQAEKQLQEQQQKSEPRKINIRYVIKKDDKKEDRN
jgi:hypothetical protein